MEWELEITLRSDLCVASGDGFSSGIDVDVCLDETGLPYIPARRIKGCLREAAELVTTAGEQATVRELFGVRGRGQAGSIVVGNARIHTLGGQDVGLVTKGSSAQEMTGLLTYVRAQTALVPGEGYVKENTLRYVRVVRQFDPMVMDTDSNPLPLVFVARVSADESYTRVLLRSAKALRNLGFGRNRGFGAVSCRLIKKSSCAQQSQAVSGNLAGSTRVTYRVRLETPLMLPQNNSSTSMEYVPGTNVLGCLASRMKDEADFDELFLSGKVRFSPLYPVDSKGYRCKPAPSFVVKAKGGLLDGSYRTCASFLELEGQQRNSVAAKPLHGGFVDGNYHPVDVRSEVVYHHSTGKTGGSDSPALYTQRCISAGQELAGFIEADDSVLMARIADALSCASKTGLSFGRSKTAQYARCSLVEFGSDVPRGRVSVKRGETYAFLLDSDALVADDALGCACACYEAIVGEIRLVLGQDADAFKSSDVEEGVEVPGTSLAYRTVTGYNTKWNQKKPHVRAIVAGSSIVFTAAKDAVFPGEFCIGMRQAEGFGRVLVISLGEIANPIEPVVSPEHSAEGFERTESVLLQQQRSIERMRNISIDYAEQARSRGLFCATKLNPAFVGRLTSMAEESASVEEFEERISSISRKAKRDDADALVSGLLAHLSSSGFGSPVWPEARECLLLVLTLGKYYAKQDGIANAARANGGVDD